MESSLDKLAMDFQAQPDTAAFAAYRTLVERDARRFKDMSAHPRIYPLYFAPIILAREGGRAIVPMRYRVRPHDSREEPPAKYNLYNARLDGLSSRQTWRGLFMRQHGVAVFRAFFEWVTGDDGKKCVVQFTPGDGASAKDLCAPVLYDYWQSADQSEGYFSFAVITTDPPVEVRAAGHDRCPVILEREAIDPWLHPASSGAAAIEKILHTKPSIKFLSGRVPTFPK